MFKCPATGLLSPRPFRKLHLLQFTSVDLSEDTTKEVLDIIGHLIHIERLEISFPYFCSTSSPATIRPIIERRKAFSITPIDLGIMKLVVGPSIHDHEHFFRRLLETRTICGLECLDVFLSGHSGDHDTTWDSLEASMEGSCRSIQSLNLTSGLYISLDSLFEPAYPRMTEYIKSTIPNLVCLQSFKLCIELPRPDSGHIASKTWSLYATALHALPPSVRHVTLVLHPAPDFDECILPPVGFQRESYILPCIVFWGRIHLDWSPIRAAFSRLGQLETVTFAVRRGSFLVDQESDWKKIRKELPELDNRGLLRYKKLWSDYLII
ncbi:hypothetical protein PHLCEN_2v3960 [Hermanssonia centrifuga]|uniref:Uncharacterized protein n=1 Tax=Hermanssonia centrifuga TaxID=98765 RepID=A0A2R6Q7I9_9APHY|nr:hypothetical protein PHLCEN_2v3960 [Hermanssonia centrifuga]